MVGTGGLAVSAYRYHEEDPLIFNDGVQAIGGPWGPFGASWAALGAPWAAPKSLSAEKPEFVDSMAFFEVFWASESSPGAS